MADGAAFLGGALAAGLAAGPRCPRDLADLARALDVDPDALADALAARAAAAAAPRGRAAQAAAARDALAFFVARWRSAGRPAPRPGRFGWPAERRAGVGR